MAALVVAAQIGVSLLVRTASVHNYLAAQLEKAFGRPVQVRHFNFEIFPSPRIYATSVIVGEDAAFGYEYFLRAEHMTAGVRWRGLLGGQFEFGTLSLGQPVLTLVRSREGRWNLEDWLPPARKNVEEHPAQVNGPSRASVIGHRLEKIEIDDGRIDFKNGDVKMPFALTGVNGSVEQMSSERWKMQLEAQPWRSGVALQATGVMKVSGDLAGTSARLQPASLNVQWDRVSLADLLRLLSGRDYGVRGTFALEATAKSGAPAVDPLVSSKDSFVGDDWSFSLRASATQIHRWDLIERSDNPNITAKVAGRWNVALKKITAENFTLETPASNIRGTAEFGGKSTAFMEVRVMSAGIQAVDLLSCYRAFRPEAAEGISANGYFTGTADVQGWPARVTQAEFSTSGGVVRVAGVDETMHLSPFRAVIERGRLAVNPARLSFVSLPAAVDTTVLAGSMAKTTKRRPSEEGNSEIDLVLMHDFASRAGSLGIQGRVKKAENLLKVSAAFGNTINRGWDLAGPVRGDLRREWSPGSPTVWKGSMEATNAQVTAVGLNQAVELQQARLEWHDGTRVAQIGQAAAFGATWSGSITEAGNDDSQRPGAWNVQLHADHLDATEMDRWVGPRARPGWLQRLLPSLLGGSAKNAAASELVRRLNVTGELQADEFTIEKLKLEQLRVQGTLHDLQLDVSDGRAKWAGGNVRATMSATFVPRPVYDVAAQVDGVDLAQLPIDPATLQRLGGIASGDFRLRTAGVGRAELLQKLVGRGDIHLANLEFRGWDVNASVAYGEVHAGVSRWTSGDGGFTLRDRSVVLEGMRLNGAAQTTFVNGTVSFSREANLAVQTGSGRRAVPSLDAAPQILKVVGPLDGPRVSRDKSTPRQPAD